MTLNTPSFIGMSLVVFSGSKRTITQNNNRLEKQQYSLALEAKKTMSIFILFRLKCKNHCILV